MRLELPGLNRVVICVVAVVTSDGVEAAVPGAVLELASPEDAPVGVAIAAA